MECDSDNDWQLGLDLSSRWRHVLRSALWTDINFEVGEDETVIKAHRQVLSGASPVFAAMFYGPVAEEKSSIRVPDVTPEIFNYLLEFIYTDTIESIRSLTIEKLPEIDYVSKKYLVPRLMTAFAHTLSNTLTPENVIRCYKFAVAIEYQPLIDDCAKVISRATSVVFKTGSHLKADLETLEFIFSQDKLTIFSELELLTVAESYAKANGIKCGPYDSCESSQNEGEQQKTILPLLKQIRFLSMQPRDLTINHMRLREFLCESDVLSLILNTTHEGAAPLPEGFSTNRKPRYLSVPFIMDISGEVVVGRVFKLRGWTHPEAYRFDIDLLNNNEMARGGWNPAVQVNPNSPTHGHYVIFHFSVQFYRERVVRNSYLGSWDRDQDDGAMPFQAGQPFELAIELSMGDFLVFVNGNFFCSYRYRTSCTDISHLSVKGNVDVDMISLT